jgi:rRNA maturation RNase YbeY
MKDSIFFFNEQSDYKIQEIRRVKTWIKKIFREEDTVPGNINIILCSDSVLLELNKKYLHRDNYTDIITFTVDSNDGLSGDLYISSDRIAENALKYKIELRLELLRVIAHGILHLIGYEDNTREQIKIMRDKEDQYLKLVSFSKP